MQPQKLQSPWVVCSEKEKNEIYEEIIFELHEFHPLYSYRFDIVAHNERREVLVEIEAGEFPYAVIYPTWSFHAEEGDLPEIVLLISYDEFLRRYAEDDCGR